MSDDGGEKKPLKEPCYGCSRAALVGVFYVDYLQGRRAVCGICADGPMKSMVKDARPAAPRDRTVKPAKRVKK